MNLRGEAGLWESTGWWGERESGGTRSCCHCQRQWVHKPGSGRLVGFCQNCAGYVCGPACAECVHWEQRVENAEAGLPECHKPVRIWVPPGIDGVT